MDSAISNVPDAPADVETVPEKGGFDADDPASSELASELAESWLEEAGNPAMIGVQDFVLADPVIDHLGMAHVRVQQTLDGVPVFEGEGIVHLHPDGSVAFTDAMVRDIQLDTTPDLSSDDAIAAASALFDGSITTVDADLLVLRHDGDHLVWRVQISDFESASPSRPVFFIDAHTGEQVWRYENLQTAKNRLTYSANNKTVLPGTLKRSEGGAAIGDLPVDDAHDFAGVTYDYYFNVQGRDSYNGAGATITSSAHYSVSYENAYWDGSQMVYGDGATYFYPLSEAQDVVSHELTHAVTSYSANLTYSGESGGLNEATSDIMGAMVEAYGRGWPADSDAKTWEVGEDIVKPALGTAALRFMNNPPADGASIDNYANYTSSTDVHYSSGIANKAAYLMAQDASLSTQDVGNLWYRALTMYMTASTNFAGARTATINAATDLFGAGSAQVTAVGTAWDSVGVGAPLTYTTFDTKTSLSNSTGASTTYSYVTPTGATSIKFAISGGTGDADLYVKFGSSPTTTSYDCRPYLTGNTETCTFTPAQTGTYYVMLRAYSTYSGVTLTASSAGGSAPPPPPTTETNCTDGIDNDADGLTDCSDSDCATNTACTTSSSCPGGTFTGNLSSTNTSDQFQDAVARSGLFNATLTGDAGTDFDLYLEYQSGSRWKTRASSLGSTSTESVTYNEASTVLHRWNVKRYSGTGNYTLCIK
jgi:vibriolysin